MKSVEGFALTLMLGVTLAIANADQTAKLDDGTEVILKDDGTWAYAKKPTPPTEDEPPKGPGITLERSAEATETHRGSKNNYTLYLTPRTWKKGDTPPGLPADFMYQDADQECGAMVIAERISLTTEKIKTIGLENARAADKNAKIVDEQPCTVNGKKGLMIQIDANINDIPLRYFNCYYGGPEGSIQVVTWTTVDLFEENKPKLEGFISGVVIHARTSPPDGAKQNP